MGRWSLYLTLHKHNVLGYCIKMGSDMSHSAASLIVEGEVTP